MEKLGLPASYAIGARVPQLKRHAKFQAVGAEDVALPWFVIEADESDGSLREFHPVHSILLNVDEEHLDFYANLEAVCSEFQAFARQTSGFLVFCADDPRLAELSATHPRALSYGFHPLAQYRAVIEPVGQKSSPVCSFSVWNSGARLGEFQLALVGEKNISNATAVIALLHKLGVPAEKLAAALAPFRGAARRQEEIFRDERFRVFDDYGHHPSEIHATLRALRSLAPRRLLVAFQPHRFTRTQHLLAQFSECFREADRLWIAEVYAASEAEIPGVNGKRMADAIRRQGQEVEFVPDLESLRRKVRQAMEPGDLVLFLGAGDITRAAHEMSCELKQENPSMNEKIATGLAAIVSHGTVIRQKEPLARRTTLRVGGCADFYIEPASEPELGRILQFCSAEQVPFLILGRGSNLLIRDGGIRGVVLCLSHSAFSHLEITGEKMCCGAGVKLKAISVEARRHGLAGLEFLEGIPGSLGGALRMNAGAMGSWLFEVVESIRFMDLAGKIYERPASEVHVEYRGCPLFKNHIALGAVLKGVPSPQESIEERMKTYSRKRWDSQPAESSAGCIFKNPTTIPAGKLIDELGLKGTRVGGAMVSEVHGNFIVNQGNATAGDVLNLIEIIRERARSSRGIHLETEVEIIGENEN